MYFDSNIKFLRSRKKLTQDQLSNILDIKRSTLNNYENGISGPSIQSLVILSDYFHVAIDTLLRVDLAKLRESQLYELEHGQDVFLKGSNLRVMATTVDRMNRDNIELVSEKAKAGYTNDFPILNIFRSCRFFSFRFCRPNENTALSRSMATRCYRFRMAPGLRANLFRIGTR